MTYKADLLDAIWREEYAFQHDKRYQPATETSSNEYGNEIAHRTATLLADNLVASLKHKTVDELKAYLQSYEDGKNLSYQKRFRSLMKEIDQTRMINCIDSNVRNVVYSLQTAMKAYGAEGFRISVTVDDIVVEQIEEDDE